MSAEGFVKVLKRHLAVVICFAGSAIFAGVAVYRHTDVSAAGDALQDGQDRLEKISRNTRFASTLSDHLHRLDVYESRISSSVMNPAEKARNLAYVYGTGVKLGLNVTRAEQSVPVVEAPKESAAPVPNALKSYSTMNLDIELEGEFASILRFMDTVRSEHFFLRFESVTIHPSKDPNGRLQATLALCVLTEKTGGAK